MTQVTIPLMWRIDGRILVPAETLSGLLRSVAALVADWPQQGAETATVEALREMLGRVADQIDVDCIAVASELETE